MEETIQALKRILDESRDTIVLCGSGMTEESGFVGIKKPERAYEIECKYGASPEEIFSSAYYSTRTEAFFEFYKNEILEHIPEPGESSYALAAMEKAGRLQCIVTSNVFEQEQRGGCENVINLHGTVFENRCPRCGERYSVEYMKNAKHMPYCSVCGAVIRPGVSLFGQMVDSRVMTRTTEEIEKADVLLLLGSTLRSDVFSNYLRYFNGSNLIIIHKEAHYTDTRADLTILDEPRNVLRELGY
ncbi:MAG: Sir2 family NAD-dependent protein deacetylase [Clostridium sp.]